MSRFLLIVAAFLTYTAFKAVQLWPLHATAAIVGSAALFIVMLGGTFIYRGNVSVFEKPWFRAFTWIGSLTMATWATFILISIPLDLISAFTTVAPAVRIGLLAVSVGLVIAGFVQVRRGPRVRPITIRIPNITTSFQGLKIAHISDLHVGPTLRKNYVDGVVRRINAAEPDLIVFTGDMADAHVLSIETHLEPFRDLNCRHGAFFITGNHEYYWGAHELVAKMKDLGFKPLLNENALVKINDGSLLIAGVTDPAGEMLEGHNPNMAKAAASSSAADLKLLLAHRPGAAHEAEPLGFDLQLSGHTHAGQFFPFTLLIGFFHKYSRGLYRHGRMWVYVNPGTGYWGPASRLGVSPEISLITLDS